MPDVFMNTMVTMTRRGAAGVRHRLARGGAHHAPAHHPPRSAAHCGCRCSRCSSTACCSPTSSPPVAPSCTSTARRATTAWSSRSAVPSRCGGTTSATHRKSVEIWMPTNASIELHSLARGRSRDGRRGTGHPSAVDALRLVHQPLHGRRPSVRRVAGDGGPRLRSRAHRCGAGGAVPARPVHGSGHPRRAGRRDQRQDRHQPGERRVDVRAHVRAGGARAARPHPRRPPRRPRCSWCRPSSVRRSRTIPVPPCRRPDGGFTIVSAPPDARPLGLTLRRIREMLGGHRGATTGGR